MFTLSVRRLLLTFALAAFAAAGFFHPLKPAYACSCMMPGTPLEARDAAQTVFSGTVSALGRGPNGLIVTFDVDQVWKGPEGAQLSLTTADSSASCGYEFVQGEQYLVYGFAQDGQLSTGLCTRTAPLANAGEDLAALGDGAAAPAAPAEPAVEASVDAPWAPAALAGIAVVGAGLVVFAVMRRRRTA